MSYLVQFIGYAAYVKKAGKNQDIASLDFVSGAACLFGQNRSRVIVPSRCDLAPFIATLPAHIDDLYERTKETAKGCEVEWSNGDNELWLTPGTDPKKAVSDLTRRWRKLEPVLQEADIIGSQIKRRPYSEFIEEIERTGRPRIEYHGFGLFINGKIAFRPVNITKVVKIDAQEQTVSIGDDVVEFGNADWSSFSQGGERRKMRMAAAPEPGLSSSRTKH